MSNREPPIVAILGVGEMGAAVAKRLRLSGAQVRVSLKGRSADSERRARQAGLEIVNDDSALLNDAAFVLSIVPPGVAVQVAEQYRTSFARTAMGAIFADCNAIAPATARRIGEVLAGCACRYIDAGIIGGPPPEDLSKPGPRFYASGPDAPRLAELNKFGLDVEVMDGPIGAASGLKMSYAGLTKGITALGTAMVAAAMRDGLGDALRSELARTQPQILRRIGQSVPAMFPKAYRWVAEMEEIAAFLGGDERGAMIYRGAACLYQRIAEEGAHRDAAEGLRALVEFCSAALASSPAK
jgi:3-hydroxyisobutyrate dehydrogenase-like beta-hydroxyacid dehydrogenase